MTKAWAPAGLAGVHDEYDESPDRSSPPAPGGRVVHLRTPFYATPSRLDTAPDLLPVLSPGRHRHPGKGACFMEMASYLAGERWSDHPGCAHPTLAALARDVNDHLDAEHRAQLVPMIPDVIGTATEDPHVPLLVARACALAVLGLESPHEGIAALALLHAEAALNVLDGRRPESLTAEARRALDHHDDAVRWARRFTGQVGRHRRTGTGSRADQRASAAAVRSAVVALGLTAGGQDRMVDLLREAIGICRAAVSAPAVRRDASTRA
jgi:hypothetical protein